MCFWCVFKYLGKTLHLSWNWLLKFIQTMKIKSKSEYKMYLYKTEDCVTSSLDPERWSLWSYLVVWVWPCVLRVNRHISHRGHSQKARFLESSLNFCLHSLLWHLHSATFLSLSLLDAFYSAFPIWLNTLLDEQVVTRYLKHLLHSSRRLLCLVWFCVFVVVVVIFAFFFNI